MNKYEELVERCWAWPEMVKQEITREDVKRILADVFRTLETVTPEMRAAPVRYSRKGVAHDFWLAMLRASPLAPPKEAP